MVVAGDGGGTASFQANDAVELGTHDRERHLELCHLQLDLGQQGLCQTTLTTHVEGKI